jgi:hypothetical protein
MITLGQYSNSPTTFSGASHGAATGRTANFGYQQPHGIGAHAGVMSASAPQYGGKQLTASEPWSTGGPAQSLIGRAANFAKGLGEGGGPGGGGGAAEAGEGAEAAGAAEELAPLALAL